MRVVQRPAGTRGAHPSHPVQKDSSEFPCIWVSWTRISPRLEAASCRLLEGHTPRTAPLTHLIQGSFLCKDTFLTLVSSLEAVL